MRLLSLISAFLLVTVPLLAGCEGERPPEEVASDVRPVALNDDRVERALDENMPRLLAYAAAIESALRPEPLLRPNQIAAFDRYRNPQHLARARQLGIAQPVTSDAIRRHLDSGRLVELEDNRYWIVRDLDYSSPYVTPDVIGLLEEIGQRFHAELDERGLPPLRMEITSVLRTAEDQARLRRVNPNAARGESTHQFGTTVDIAYSSFVAPLDPVVDLDLGEVAWMEPYLRQVERLAAETGAARMSRELQAILGHVLRAMQNEGKVMVTMEVLQPVYHITVSARY